ncbi:HlyD family efflux transporter periplasmic adaptor subunit [bacterium]|nr:HlyD family efflux transporter periplasmic adaptor subunit [bacterium]
MASKTTSFLSNSKISTRRRSSRRRGGYIAKAALFSLLVAGAVGGYYYFFAGSSGPVHDEEMFHTVAPGNFEHDVIEKGEVESARNVDVFSEVRSSREVNNFEILWVIDEGKQVEEGDVLVRLDSSALEEAAKLQELDLSGSQAGLAKAENELEAAQIAMTEYVEGLFVQEEKQIQADITFAEETLRRAEEYYAYSSRLASKGFVTSLQLAGDKFAVEKARIELENARHKLKVLRDQTMLKTVKELESKIGVAKADLESAKERNSIEQNRLNFFLEQIKNCTITAPATGQVVYANERGNRDASEFIVEPGTPVRERQTIIRLPDYSAMQVHVLINESRVALIDPGMRATITLDAFDGMALEGTVTKVNEYPEPISRFGPQVKRYAAVVTIDGSPRQIKPGLTANVAIHVDKQDNVLMTPIQSVLPWGEDYYCMVQNGDSIEARKVSPGSNNSRFVVIQDGLKDGDLVALSPRGYLDNAGLPELTEEQLAGTSKKGRGPGGRGGPGGPGGRAKGGRPGGGPPMSPGQQAPSNPDAKLVDRKVDQPNENQAGGNNKFSTANGPNGGKPGQTERVASTTRKLDKEDPVRIADDQTEKAAGGAQ